MANALIRSARVTGGGGERRTALMTCGAILAAGLSAVSPAAGAQPPLRWAPLGPDGAVVESLAAAPTSAGILWAAIPYFGVWKSLDAGGLFAPTSLPTYGVTSVVADPVDPLVAYATTDTGIAKTVDGGAHWSILHLSSGPVGALAVASSSTLTLYDAEAEALNVSRDGGTTWEPTPPGGPVTALAIDPTDPAKVYVAGISFNDESFTYSSFFAATQDGGVTWKSPTQIPRLGFPYGTLIVDPAHPATLFATDADQGAARSDDRGATWRVINAGLPASSYTALALDPNGGALYLGERRDADKRGRSSGAIWKSEDGGATWAQVWSGLPAIASLSVDQRLPHRVYAGTLGGAPLVSTDAGAHWVAAGAGLKTWIVDVVADPRSPGILLAATGFSSYGPYGVERSTDGGHHWQLVAPPLGIVSRLVADPHTAGVFYALGEIGVAKSVDSGATWSDAGKLAQIFDEVFDLAVNPFNHQELWAVGSNPHSTDIGHALTLSHDGGMSWAPVSGLGATGGASVVLSSLAFDPTTPGVLYVGGPSGFFASRDGGASWSDRTAALGVSINGYTGALGPLHVGAAHEVYAVIAPGTLLRSADNGLSWVPISAGLPPTYDLAIDPSGIPLFASTTQGVYRSDDGGVRWTAENLGLSDPVGRLFLTPPPTSTLYGATATGVFAAPIPAGFCAPGVLVLCLADGRFSLQVTWSVGAAPARSGQATPLSPASGGFSFFSPDNLELIVKIVNGSAVNGSFWVFAAGTSDVAYSLVVTDTRSGQRRTYTNPAGKLSSFVDTQTFRADRSAPSASPALAPSPATASAAAAVAPPRCDAASGALCLGEHRFALSVTWQLAGASAAAIAVPVSQTSGVFWFFAPQNPELLVKVIDGSSVNGKFWVFAAGLSSVAYTLNVVDTATGRSRQYVHPAGAPASWADTSF